jgi:ABC-2 type transport system permease protein
MSGFMVLLRKEIREQLKTSKVLIAVAVFLFFGLSTPVLTKYLPEIIKSVPSTGGVIIQMPPPVSADSLTGYVGNLAQLGVMVAVLLAMGAIAREVETGTAAMVLSKPVSRLSFILAKLQAESLTFLAAFLLGGLACWGYTLALFGDAHTAGFFYQNLLLLLFFIFCLSVTLAFSSLMKSQLAAGGLALAVIVFLSAISGLPWVGPYLPGALISWGNRLVLGAQGMGTGGVASSWGAVAVTVGLCVIAIYLTWATLRKKEL